MPRSGRSDDPFPRGPKEKLCGVKGGTPAVFGPGVMGITEGDLMISSSYSFMVRLSSMRSRCSAFSSGVRMQLWRFRTSSTK